MRQQEHAGAGRNARALLAAGLALCTLLFAVFSSSHIHSAGQDDATCRLCQAAHVGITTAPSAEALPALLIERAELPPLLCSVALELFLHNAPSRAPPSA